MGMANRSSAVWRYFNIGAYLRWKSLPTFAVIIGHFQVHSGYLRFHRCSFFGLH